MTSGLLCTEFDSHLILLNQCGVYKQELAFQITYHSVSFSSHPHSSTTKISHPSLHPSSFHCQTWREFSVTLFNFRFQLWNFSYSRKYKQSTSSKFLCKNMQVFLRLFVFKRYAPPYFGTNLKLKKGSSWIIKTGQWWVADDAFRWQKIESTSEHTQKKPVYE